MPRFSTSIVPDFVPWALMVANVGTWRSSLATERLRCDSVMAEMFGLSEGEAHHGVPFSRVRDAIHPDDRFIFDRKNADIREAGGSIVMEYRVVPKPGVLRRVLIRGHYDLDLPNGTGETGHGIAIDVTSARADGAADEKPFYALSGRPRDETVTPLHRVSDAAVALRREVDAMDEVPGLRAATDAVLRIIARRLAKDLPRETIE